MQFSNCPQSLSLEAIRNALKGTSGHQHSSHPVKKAAVAMLLRGEPPSEFFFIIRAAHDDDPWSGDIGFPGGKLEAGESPQECAERETAEEVAIDLTCAELLGSLEPIRGAHLPVEVSCLVYHLPNAQEALHNHEVSQSFWCKVEQLLNPLHFGEYQVRFGDEHLIRPGIRILPQGQPILWGITYRLLHQFFDTLAIPFPPERF